MPWLATADRATLRAWCEHEVIGSSVFMALVDGGIADKDGKLRETWLNAWRNIRAAQLRYGQALGLSPAARLSIKQAGENLSVDLALAASQLDKAEGVTQGNGEEAGSSEGADSASGPGAAEGQMTGDAGDGSIDG